MQPGLLYLHHYDIRLILALFAGCGGDGRKGSRSQGYKGRGYYSNPGPMIRWETPSYGALPL